MGACGERQGGRGRAASRGAGWVPVLGQQGRTVPAGLGGVLGLWHPLDSRHGCLGLGAYP